PTSATSWGCPRTCSFCRTTPPSTRSRWTATSVACGSWATSPTSCSRPCGPRPRATRIPSRSADRAVRSHAHRGGRTMAVKFLTDEWAAAAQDAMNADEGFRNALGSNHGSLQQVVRAADGERSFCLKLADGAAHMAMGQDASADATISQDYDTAAAIWKNELSPVAA